jgi:FKBP-type peptidyl-prolyl cis-trans isomerase SlyD
MSDRIGKGKVVALRYTMRSNGKLLDDSGDEPEQYLHGSGAVVRGLERALEGRQAGERFSVELAPRDAFGPRKRGGPGPQPVPRATFPEGADLKPGVAFSAETPDGAPVRLYITRVDGDAVFIDRQHPYAGMTLRYEVEVVSVRDATADEVTSGGPSSSPS